MELVEEKETKVTEAENREMIRAYREDGDQEAREDFFRRNEGLVRHIAHKYKNTGLPLEELKAIARFGMLKGFNTFNLEREGIKIATYTTRCMGNEILMTLRRGKKHKGTVSLDEPLVMDEKGGALTVMDLAHDDSHQDMELLEKREAISVLLKKANERLKGIDLEIFLNGVAEEPLNQHELAEKLGLSQSYISRIEKRTFQQVRTWGVRLGIRDTVEKTSGRRAKVISKKKKEGAGEHMTTVPGITLKQQIAYLVAQHPQWGRKEIAEKLGKPTATISTYLYELKKEKEQQKSLKKPKNLDLQKMVDNAVVSDLNQLIPTSEVTTKQHAKAIIETTVKAYEEKAPLVELKEQLMVGADPFHAPAKHTSAKQANLSVVSVHGYMLRALVETLLRDINEEDVYNLYINIERKEG